MKDLKMEYRNDVAVNDNILLEPKIVDELNLSNRAYKVCKNAGFSTLKDIVNHYEKNDSFRNIRGCGEKVDRELMIIAERSRTSASKLVVDLSNLNGAFTLNEMKVLENLSDKACQTCINENLLCLKDIAKYFQKHDTFVNIEGCDTPTNLELLLILKKNIFDIAAHEELSNYNLVINYIQQKFFVNLLDYIPDFKNYYEQKKLPFFKILDIIIKHSGYFSPQDKEILNNLYIDNALTLQEIAAKLNVTGEAIRLKMLTLTKKIFYNEKSVSNILLTLLKKSFENMLLKTNKNLIAYNNTFFESINQTNQTSFSYYTIALVLSIYYKDYKFITESPKNKEGVNEFIKTNHVSNDLKHYYFCRGNEFVKCFPIYINYFKNTLNKKITKDITISAHEILMNNNEEYQKDYLYYKKTSKEHGKTLRTDIPEELKTKYADCLKALGFITKNEYGISGRDNIYNINKNTSITKQEHIVEALKELNRPAHISEIFSIVNKRHPEIFSDISRIRSTCHSSNAFINFGRSSTYGLKIWEKEKTNVKGGSIREIAKECIIKNNGIADIKTITKYVMKYRKTNQKSIMTSLRLDNSRGFTYKGKGLFALAPVKLD